MSITLVRQVQIPQYEYRGPRNGREHSENEDRPPLAAGPLRRIAGGGRRWRGHRGGGEWSGGARTRGSRSDVSGDDRN